MSSYNFEELKRLSGFSGDDSRILRKLLPEIRDGLPEIIERFLGDLSLPEPERQGFEASARIEEIREDLLRWLEEIFLGPHDAASFEKHLETGTRLIDAGASQVRIVLAGALIRRRLQEAITAGARAKKRNCRRALGALDRILDLELALIAGCDCGKEIGAREQAELALRRERDLVQRYLDVAGAIICVVAADETFTLINRKGCELLGAEEREIIGKPFYCFLPERIREEVRGVFRRLMAGDIDPVAHYENPILSRNGEERTVSWHNTVLRDDAGNIIGALSSGLDVTERRRMEERIVEQASLARLGEMAAVVAHEVRNTLAGISGALQVMSARGRPDGEDADVLQDIFERIGALNNAVDDILFFARPSPPYIIEVSILPLVLETAARLRRNPNYRCTAVRVGGEDLVVPCDANQMRQALFNLVLNAAQAVDGDGEISISISNGGGCCRIVIEDDGPGIPPELRDKVFEPFFTTKCRGTGLGLPIAKRIIHDHSGEVRLAASRKRGTRMTIELPLSRGAADHATV